MNITNRSVCVKNIYAVCNLAFGIECSNVIAECLVFAAMTLVLLAVAQKVAVQLLQVTLSQRNVGALRRKDAERAPSSLELIQLRQESQKLGRNLEGIGVDHTRMYTGLDRNKRALPLVYDN
jgi:hypothetical protein